jgi:hypothetical protein
LRLPIGYVFGPGWNLLRAEFVQGFSSVKAGVIRQNTGAGFRVPLLAAGQPSGHLVDAPG